MHEKLSIIEGTDMKFAYRIDIAYYDHIFRQQTDLKGHNLGLK